MPSTWEPVFMPLRKLHFWVLRNSIYPTSLQSCTLFLSLQAAWIASECRFKSTLRIQSRAFGEDSPTRVVENLQSSILDWRFPNKSPGESSLFNLQSWSEDSPRRALENLQSSIFNPGLKIPKSELKSEHQVWISSLNIRSELRSSSSVMVCAC